MLDFPNAKINLGLHILSKRDDGYHEIDTCFYPILNHTDALELIPNSENSLTVLGLEDLSPDQNLAWKALQAFNAATQNDKPYQIILQKHIPTGAGLGGGSADAAWTLKMMNENTEEPLSQKELIKIATHLGADVPFFILNTPSIASGIGEIMKPITLDLSEYHIELIHSDIHISTAWAFGSITPSAGRKSIEDIVSQPIPTWKSELHNDFEDVVFKKYPSLEETQKHLYNRGAIYASMTGTGSTIYGIFEK